MPMLPPASETPGFPPQSFSLWFSHLGVSLALGYDAHLYQTWLVLITFYLDQYRSHFDACSSCSLICIL